MNSAVVVLFFNLFFLLARCDVSASACDEIESQEARCACVNVITGECTAGEEGSIVTDYYSGEAYSGSVKQQFIVDDEEGALIPLNRYVYHDNFTEVFDQADQKTIFRYSDVPLVTDIESYDASGDPICFQHLDWDTTSGSPKLISRTVLNKGQDVVLEQHFAYDKEGKIVQKNEGGELAGLYKVLWDFIQDKFTYPEGDFIEVWFGKMYPLLAGWRQEALERNTQGAREINEKVRVTYINGILNSSQDCSDTAQTLSKYHGETKIHYVYRPTKGWGGDMMSSIEVKAGLLTPQATLLVEMWKDLINELGGVNSGGMIVHYAHSIGSSDTWNAKNLLSTEERKMLRVVTLGSPVMIHKNGLHSVDNYVSVRDGVCWADPIGYYRGRQKEKDVNVIFVGSWWGKPLTEHELSCEAYDEVLRRLGKEFVDQYGQ